jgi:hypothetical protein
MDSITISLDVDDAGLILNWIQTNAEYNPSEYERLQLESIGKLKELIKSELDNLSAKIDYHDPNTL